MKKAIVAAALGLVLAVFPGCGTTQEPVAAAPAAPETAVAEILPEPVFTEPETTVPTTVPEPVYDLTDGEKEMLLKIGMAERGGEDCTECVALVIRTILNRVESDRFGSTIQGVLFAQDQFTPVSDGSYYSAEPNQRCYDALDMVVYGWDESQGALYYEWCEGESWHSRNLHLLFQHCDVRFYD